jgi:hypothetical protein
MDITLTSDILFLEAFEDLSDFGGYLLGLPDLTRGKRFLSLGMMMHTFVVEQHFVEADQPILLAGKIFLQIHDLFYGPYPTLL